VICGFVANAETAPQATAAVEKGQRLFMTGHSFHMFMRSSLPELVESAGIKGQELIGTQFIGGSRVIQIWNVADEKNAAKAALKAGKVDVLTTSPHALIPDPGIDNFVALALANNPNVRVTVQQSWPAYEGISARDPDPAAAKAGKALDRDNTTGEKLMTMFKPYTTALGTQVDALNKSAGKSAVFLVPTGDAVIALREKVRLGQVPGIKTQSEMFLDRIGHAGAAVQALNAYCHFAVIYRRTPIGLPALKVLGAYAEPERAKINQILQELAWEAVTAESRSGVGK